MGATRVPVIRPIFHGLTRAFIIETAILTVSGLRPSHVSIIEWARGAGTADVVIDGARMTDVNALQNALAPYATPGIDILVRPAP